MLSALRFLLAALAATTLACSVGDLEPDRARGEAAHALAVEAERSTAEAPSQPLLAQQEPTSAAPLPDSAPVESAPFSSKKTVDLWVRGGSVLDGSGGPARAADVVVDDGRIVHVGLVDPELRARATLDAHGLTVTPGFIDAHAHSDPTQPVDHLLAMGVTTIVVGQDGWSPANRIGRYLTGLERQGLRVNVASLVGHATVRSLAEAHAKPTEDELARMAELVDSAMEDGAFGLSSGLEYDPGSVAKAGELAAIARPVGARGGVVMSHLRSEDDGAIDAAIDELADQCEASGARMHIAHLKIVEGRGAERARRLLGHLDELRARGLRVTADVYPYVASHTTIGILFPAFARPPNDYAAARTRRRVELLDYLRDRVNRRFGPEATHLDSGKWVGRTLAEAAEVSGLPFEELLAEMGPTGAEATYFVIDEDVMRALLADANTMLGTDGSLATSHPRGHGTFARVMGRYVRDERVLTLPEAVRKATSLAADTIGLTGRGRLARGYAADLVVFDPASITDHATFEAPAARSTGVELVVVGGVIEWRDGVAVRGKGGRALRRGSSR
ncbi:MAG: amidohydrolase family protein [Polyangiaceae bacterium]